MIHPVPRCWYPPLLMVLNLVASMIPFQQQSMLFQFYLADPVPNHSNLPLFDASRQLEECRVNKRKNKWENSVVHWHAWSSCHSQSTQHVGEYPHHSEAIFLFNLGLTTICCRCRISSRRYYNSIRIKLSFLKTAGICLMPSNLYFIVTEFIGSPIVVDQLENCWSSSSRVELSSVPCYSCIIAIGTHDLLLSLRSRLETECVVFCVIGRSFQSMGTSVRKIRRRGVSHSYFVSALMTIRRLKDILCLLKDFHHDDSKLQREIVRTWYLVHFVNVARNF